VHVHLDVHARQGEVLSREESEGCVEITGPEMNDFPEEHGPRGVDGYGKVLMNK
jgi:hypothetical protein